MKYKKNTLVQIHYAIFHIFCLCVHQKILLLQTRNSKCDIFLLMTGEWRISIDNFTGLTNILISNIYSH